MHYYSTTAPSSSVQLNGYHVLQLTNCTRDGQLSQEQEECHNTILHSSATWWTKSGAGIRLSPAEPFQLQTSYRDGGLFERLTQPESQLPSISYNHNILTKPICANAPQSCSKLWMQAGDSLTGLSMCCDCKMNWAAAFQIALCNVTTLQKNNLS